MTLLPCVRFLALLVVFFSATFATAAERVLDRATLNRLTALKPGVKQNVDAFPVSATRTASIRFERVQIYSDDAHIYVMTADGRKEVPRSNRIFLRGYSDDGTARVAMSLNPDSSFAEGGGESPDGSFALTLNSARKSLSAVALESTIPAGVKLDFRCGNEFVDLSSASRKTLAQKLGLDAAAPAVAGPHSLRLATVGVDTDTLFMSTLFSNNTTNAQNWIASMFNTMNIMYERDLVVRLLQGTTFLRTVSDPYGAANHVPADGTDLNVFGTFWQNNEAAVPRAFATLLSGRGPCDMNGCQASGIAWINSYCQKPSNGGSYSVVQVFSNLGIDPQGAIAAHLLGHELGHNFGADHTHCTDAVSGQSPVATNTIDQCFNGEGGSGCYNGMVTSCPAGPSAGTIMSYCNIQGCPNPGSQNLLQFHSTQITKVLLPALTANAPGCLNTTDDIFYNGFE